MNKKPITIDDLAVMVQKGFTNVDQQFAQVSQQFTQVHHELKAIRKELLGVVYRPEFDDLQDRVREMESVLSTLKKRAA
jgi:hypothetical protein